ncbi:M1 family metallopeptidase [Nocardia colli]|uniref:M1 family metallopeptidase n=1 Tax=Nocardia colli TaxID=2545717 RepID=A0A5N0E180_9NOCA|nr:M1 family metallopeptidase [Nocardia colli]KAA8881864.1 M1 family metallopeptidase [Nocardia colli]
MKVHSWSRCAVAAALSLSVAGCVAPPADPAAGTPGLGDPYYPMDGNGGYDVSHYDVQISYDPPTRRLAGSTRIEAVSTQALHIFELDYRGPAVQNVLLDGEPATFYPSDQHELVVIPMSPLPSGRSFTITVDYAGEQSDMTHAGWTPLPDGGSFVAGEPHSATTWFPLNDTVLNKATFSLQATVPAAWQVVSNGVKTGEIVNGDTRTVNWATGHPVAGYQTTIAIDHFDYLEQRRADGTPLVSVFAPGAADARDLAARLPEVLDFLESLYGPYPFEAAGGIYLGTDLHFSLETQTRPTYTSPPSLRTIVHENAHQWWGNSMSITHWSDICLNECFAGYTADYLWPERKEGKDIDAVYRETIAKHLADPEFWRIPLADPGAGHEFTSVYSRGPLFLHALRRLIGDDVYFAAVREFVQHHLDGNASMPELRSYLRSRSSVDLGPFFAAWLDRTTPPSDEYLYPGNLHR